MQIDAKDADAYVAAAPAERRGDLETLRAFVKKTVPRAVEHIARGMISYTLDGRTFVSLASQKRHLSLYLADLHAHRAKHAAAFAKLDVGKSCIVFQKAADLPLDTLAAILAAAPNGPPSLRAKKATRAKSGTKPAKKAPAKKTAPAKRATAKRTAAEKATAARKPTT
jgi:uncharacterized protein YdhG (YjbR/CyaY superfamily)